MQLCRQMAHSGVVVVVVVEVEVKGSEAEASPTSSISLVGVRAFTEQSTSPQPAILSTGKRLEASSAHAQMGKFKKQHLFLVIKFMYGR